MEGLTRGYAARLVKEGITVNAVAKAVMLLVDNAYMTGQTVPLSGGMAFN